MHRSHSSCGFSVPQAGVFSSAYSPSLISPITHHYPNHNPNNNPSQPDRYIPRQPIPFGLENHTNPPYETHYKSNSQSRGSDSLVRQFQQEPYHTYGNLSSTLIPFDTPRFQVGRRMMADKGVHSSHISGSGCKDQKGGEDRARGRKHSSDAFYYTREASRDNSLNNNPRSYTSVNTPTASPEKIKTSTLLKYAYDYYSDIHHTNNNESCDKSRPGSPTAVASPQRAVESVKKLMREERLAGKPDIDGKWNDFRTVKRADPDRNQSHIKTNLSTSPRRTANPRDYTSKEANAQFDKDYQRLYLRDLPAKSKDIEVTSKVGNRRTSEASNNNELRNYESSGRKGSASNRHSRNKSVHNISESKGISSREYQKNARAFILEDKEPVNKTEGDHYQSVSVRESYRPSTTSQRAHNKDIRDRSAERSVEKEYSPLTLQQYRTMTNLKLEKVLAARSAKREGNGQNLFGYQSTTKGQQQPDQYASSANANVNVSFGSQRGAKQAATNRDVNMSTNASVNGSGNKEAKKDNGNPYKQDPKYTLKAAQKRPFVCNSLKRGMFSNMDGMPKGGRR